jgi:transketolase
MRKEFTDTVERLFKKNSKLVLLLGDIGVYAFRNLMKRFPERAINIGILEQSTISFAAGIAKQGFIPIVHTIAPFIVARAFEQLKIDFGYQKLSGNFVGVGGSYDYAALGCTHHAPEDINLLKNIPGMQIVVPGNSLEFKKLFTQSYNNKSSTYYRLSSEENAYKLNTSFGKANVIQKGKKATVIAVGPVLNYLMPFIKKYDVNLIYYTTIRPFDKKILKKVKNKKFLIIEPFYFGSIINELLENNKNNPTIIRSINIPYKFLNKYGKKKDHDKELGFESKEIEKKLLELIKQ